MFNEWFVCPHLTVFETPKCTTKTKDLTLQESYYILFIRLRESHESSFYFPID